MTKQEQINLHEKNVEVLTERISNNILTNGKDTLNLQKVLKEEMDTLERLNNNLSHILPTQSYKYKVLIGSRGSGITSTLLLEASRFNKTFVCQVIIQKKQLEKKCKELNIKSPTIISIGELRENSREEVIIDLNRGNLDTEEKIRDYIDNMNIKARIITVGNNVE